MKKSIKKTKDEMPFDLEGEKYREKLGTLDLDESNKDITLVAEEEEHKAHKAVLQLIIPYFKAMFATECKESSEDVLTLPVVSSDGLKAIIEYAYSGKIHVNVESVQDILISADYLQCKNVVEICKKFIVDSINDKTCLSYYNLVTIYAEELQEFVKEFILWNFTDISQTEEFLDINQKHLIEILGATELHSQDEYKLYTAAQKWLDHNEAKYDVFMTVMTCIRFPLVPLEKLKEIEKDERLMKSDVLKASVMEAIEYRSQDKRIAVLPLPCKLRGETALIQVNSERRELTAFPLPGKKLPSDYVYKPQIKQFSNHDAEESKSGEATNQKSDDSNNDKMNESENSDVSESDEDDAQDGKLIASLPTGYQAVKKVMHLNNFLYVAALKARERESDNDCDILRYEVATNTWMNLFNIWYLPDETVAVATDKYLVFIANHPRQELDEYDDVPSSFRYSIVDDKFTVAKHYPIPYCEISEYQGCALNDLVYFCGGQISRNGKVSTSTKAFAYDPTKNEYKGLARMNQGHQEHVVATDGKFIFALGGTDTSADYSNCNPFKFGYNPFESDSDEYSSESAKPECYNPQTNQWTVLDWNLSSFRSSNISVIFVDPDFIGFEEDDSAYDSTKYTRLCRVSPKTGEYKIDDLKKLPPLLPLKIDEAPPRTGFDYPGPCRYVAMQM